MVGSAKVGRNGMTDSVALDQAEPSFVTCTCPPIDLKEREKRGARFSETTSNKWVE